jgi:hypothetical protein
MYLNKEFRTLDPRNRDVQFAQDSHDLFCRVAERENAYVVVGSVSMEPHPTWVYPTYERFNSAFVYEPARAEIGAALQTKFEYLFGKLRVQGTKNAVARFVKPVEVARTVATGSFVRDDEAGDHAWRHRRSRQSRIGCRRDARWSGLGMAMSPRCTRSRGERA